MKKFIVIFFALFLASCGSNSFDLEDIGTMEISDVKLTPQTATVDDDGYLNITVKWIRGDDEDSMNKASFSESGVLFFATQNEVYLEGLSDNSTRMFDDVYDATENNLYLKFKLENEEDNVEIIAKDVVNEIEKSFTIELEK